MLGSKTKRVAAYGKRTHRIVANDSFNTASACRRTTISPQLTAIVLDDPVLDTSPPTSPDRLRAPSPVIKKKSTTRKKVTSKPIDDPTPVRRPLAPREPAVSANIESKRVMKPSKKIGKKPPPSQMVDVELVTLDDQDITVAKERMVLKTSAQANPVSPPLPPQTKDDKKGAAVRQPRNTHREKPAIIDTTSDSEPELPPPRQKRAATRRRQIVVSSDEDEDEAQIVAHTPIPPSPSTFSPYLPPPPSSSPPPAPDPPRERPLPVRTQQRCSSPRPQYDPIANKPRQLTPIRRGKKTFPQSPGSVISLEDDESDLDDTEVNDLLNFADLSCSDYRDHAREVPESLLPLLQECNQDSPHEFSSFINSFPFDQIVQSYESELAAYSKAEFRKVGEASYSEVFGIGSVVLKIVPLRDESETKPAVYHVESPPTTYARDILREIAATRLMGELCEGIIKLLRTYIVRGKYPSLLLSLWDEYNDVNGSESIKPGEEDDRKILVSLTTTSEDTFSVSQAYAIIVLPNGGPDLETYTFSSPSKNGWMQACSIFWQVVYSIADAENLASFEVRAPSVVVVSKYSSAT